METSKRHRHVIVVHFLRKSLRETVYEARIMLLWERICSLFQMMEEV